MYKKTTYRKKTNKSKYRRNKFRVGRKTAYGKKLNMSLGTNMRCIPVTGSCYLSLQNVSLQAYIGAPRYEEILVSIPFNMIGNDIFAYVTPGRVEDLKLPSPTNTCCIGAISPIRGFSMADGGGTQVLNPKHNAFNMYPDFWCGGMLYQWEPPTAQNTFLNSEAPATYYFGNIQVDVTAFGSQNLMKNLLHTTTGAPEVVKPRVNWSRILANPWIKNRPFDQGIVKGFIKNPQAAGRLDNAYHSGINVNAAGVTGTDMTEVDLNPITNAGVANFLFRITIDPNMTQNTIAALNLGTLTVKKYFFHDVKGGKNIINMKYNDDTVKPNP